MKIIAFQVVFLFAGALVSTANVQARIQGTPGVDYPNLFSIPKTSFKCTDQKYIPGFYADLETECQVFHFCFKQRHESFLCPTGTTFNQPILACDNWYSSNCSLAPLFYIVNAGPGIETAGKNIPLLMKLKERVEDGTTTDPTEVFDKISSFYESTTEQELIESADKVASDPQVDEESVKTSGNESSVDEGKISEKDEHSSENNLSEENQHVDQSMKENDIKDSVNEVKEDVDNYEPFDQDIIYDPDMNNYFGNSAKDYEDEPETESDQFHNFYDQNSDATNQDPDMLQFLSSQDSDQTIQVDQNQVGSFDQVTEFSKRLLQSGQIRKRPRRKPTYVIMDDDHRYKFTPSVDSFVEPTESPFAESISIDTFAEINTELPDEYSFVENASYEQLAGDDQSQENSEFENTDSELNADRYGSKTSQFTENDEAVFDHEMLAEENEESDLSESIDQYQTEGTQPENEWAVEKSEDIQIYDDSDDPVIQDLTEENVATEANVADDTFVIIPDEMDSLTDEESEIQSEQQEYENFENMGRSYSAESDPQVVKDTDDIIIYDDIPESEAEPGEMQNEGTFEGSEDMSENRYAYQGQSEDEYPQFQEPDYSYDPNIDRRYNPVNFYRHGYKNGKVIPQYENPEQYQLPQKTYSGIPAGYQSDSRINYNGNDNFYSYGAQHPYVYGQPGMQQVHNGDGHYSSQYEYYDNLDGGAYSNEYGSQNYDYNVNAGNADPNHVPQSDVQYQGYPEQPGPDVQYQGYPEQPGSDVQYQGYPEQPGSDVQYQGYPEQPGSDVQYQGYPEQPGSDVQYQGYPEQPGPDVQYQGYPEQPVPDVQYQSYPEQPGSYNQFGYIAEDTQYTDSGVQNQYLHQTGPYNQFQYITEAPVNGMDSFQENGIQNSQGVGGGVTELQGNQFSDITEEDTITRDFETELMQESENDNQPEKFYVIEDEKAESNDTEVHKQVDVVQGSPDLVLTDSVDQQNLEQSGPYTQFQYITKAPIDGVDSFRENGVQRSQDVGDGVTELQGNHYSDIMEEDTIAGDFETGLMQESENDNQSEKYYVIEDEKNESNGTEGLMQVDEVQGSPDSILTDSVDEIIAEDNINEYKNIPQEEVSDYRDMSEASSDVTQHLVSDKENFKEPSPELDMNSDFNFQTVKENWPDETFTSNLNIQNPVPIPPALKHSTPFKPVTFPQSQTTGKGVNSQTENPFLNSMRYPNSMDFGPYSFGPNMGQQFSMVDSSTNPVPFSKKSSAVPESAGDSDASRLSKLATLQEKVRSMKGGKFGMFKKYLKAKKGL